MPRLVYVVVPKSAWMYSTFALQCAVNIHSTSRAYLQDTVDAPVPVTTLDGPIPRSSRPFEDSGERAGPVGTGA